MKIKKKPARCRYWFGGQSHDFVCLLGDRNVEKVEIFHRNFLRSIFKTFGFTANCILYGESGMTDMKTKIKCRLIGLS